MNNTKISSSSGIYLFGRLIPALMGFLSIPIFTRTLGTEGYGTFSLLMGTISLIIVLSTGWLESTAVRFVGRPNIQDEQNYTKTYLYLFLGTILFSTLIALLGFMLFHGSLSEVTRTYLWSAMLGFIGVALFRPAVNYYRTLEIPKKYTFTMVAYSVSRLGLAILLLSTIRATSDMIFYSYFIMGVLLAFLPIKKMIEHAQHAPFKLKMVKEMVTYGLPYIPLLTSAWVFSMFNRFALDIEMGRESVGLYAAAYNISDQSIGFLYMAIMMAIFPRLVKVYEAGSIAETEGLLTKGLSLYAIIIIPAISGFAMLGGELLQLLTSSDFLAASTIIPLLAVNTGIVGFNQYLSKPFELDKNTRTLMGIFVFGSLLNIIIVFPMIHILGLMGAVFSNTISLISIGILLFIRRGNSISIQIPWVIFGKVFIGVIIMISCLFLSDQFIPHGAGWIFLKMAIGIIFYACMILMMGLKRVLLI